jgi:hypothetical protein
VIWWMRPDIGLMRARKTRWDTRYDKRRGIGLAKCSFLFV